MKNDLLYLGFLRDCLEEYFPLKTKKKKKRQKTKLDLISAKHFSSARSERMLHCKFGTDPDEKHAGMKKNTKALQSTQFPGSFYKC